MEWVAIATQKPERNTDEKYAVLLADSKWPLPIHESYFCVLAWQWILYGW